MKQIKAIKRCEIPDVAEFLKLSRSLIRQINLINNMEISKSYQDIINKASIKVTKELKKTLAEENLNEGLM